MSLVACSPGDPARPTDPTPPPISSTGPQADLRARLAAALRPQHPTQAELVERPQTRLDLVATPWLANAEIVDVNNSELAHPRRVLTAIGVEGIGFVLTGDPGAFGTLLTSSATKVESTDTAVKVADTYLDTTRDFVRWSYRVASVDDIEWLPQPDAQQRAVRAQVEQAYGSKISKPTATRQGDAWRLTEWMVYDHRLVRHDLTITTTGAVSDTITTAYEGLPTPDSL